MPAGGGVGIVSGGMSVAKTKPNSAPSFGNTANYDRPCGAISHRNTTLKPLLARGIALYSELRIFRDIENYKSKANEKKLQINS